MPIKGVIHRDLKPGNASSAVHDDGSQTERISLLSPDSISLVPKVSDFGLAKCETGPGSSITQSRETLGTPCYMAPELTTGARDADVRTDVYGLGAILYELLTGQPPFVANTPLEVVHMVREQTPISPAELNAEVPANLANVCLKCLEKEPEQRYATAAEILAAMGS
jgi:serine/threonine-protein kinase